MLLFRTIRRDIARNEARELDNSNRVKVIKLITFYKNLKKVQN